MSLFRMSFGPADAPNSQGSIPRVIVQPLVQVLAALHSRIAVDLPPFAVDLPP